MARLLACSLIALFLALLATAQDTVQDAWTAPSVPDGATTLRHGSSFTLIWKSNIQDMFIASCGACDTTKVDLWVTSFSDQDYKNKIGSEFLTFSAAEIS
jgi:hypothetical protein